MIRFKKDVLKDDFFRLHPQLVRILGDMANYCLTHYNHVITISSMIRPQSKDSGVHETGRAVDISRYMYNLDGSGVVSQLPQKAIDEVLNYITFEYPRTDKNQTIKYHNVDTGFHFHLQVQFSKAFESFEKANIELARRRANGNS